MGKAGCLQVESCYLQTLALGFARVCFAMLINKAQGQRLKVAGLDLQAPCFSHGVDPRWRMCGGFLRLAFLGSSLFAHADPLRSRCGTVFDGLESLVAIRRRSREEFANNRWGFSSQDRARKTVYFLRRSKMADSRFMVFRRAPTPLDRGLIWCPKVGKVWFWFVDARGRSSRTTVLHFSL